MTLASGEAPRIGKSWHTTDPDFKTWTFLRVENMYFDTALRPLTHIFYHVQYV